MRVVGHEGASASWVPKSLLSILRTNIFPSTENTRLEAKPNNPGPAFSALHGPHFVIPSQWKRHVVNLHVVYHFIDSRNQARQFFGPFDHFMCATTVPARGPTHHGEDLAGLLFALPDSITCDHPHFAIFGVVSQSYLNRISSLRQSSKNFFQTMFVAMHLLDKVYGVPSVQVAPQWSDQRNQYKLPGLPSAAE